MSMIQSLSSSMGLSVGDPVFWMPLSLMLLITLLLVGLLLIDGIALGAGLLAIGLPKGQRVSLLRSVLPWQNANEAWLSLLLGVSMAAFPFAWSDMSENFYLPMLALIVGAVLRSLSIRVLSGDAGVRWSWIYCLGSLLGALGFGMLLAEYVTGQRFHLSLLAFVILMVLSMIAVFVLLAANWVLIWLEGDQVAKVASLGAMSARWCAAGMVGLSFMLALANPAIFYRWTHGDSLMMAVIWWGVMLVGFVWMDRGLRRTVQGDRPAARQSLLLLAWLLLLLMLAGIIYSIFPFLILDELTVWDAAAPIESLSIVTVCAGLIVPVLIVWQGLSGFRMLCASSVSEYS